MASALDTARATIFTRLATALPTLLIAYPGTPFTPPTATAWARVSLLWGNGMLITMGATNRNSVVGLVQVEVFTPAAQGDGSNMRLADSVRDVYNRADADGVRYGVPSGPQVAMLDSVWYRALVRIPFSVDELVVV